MRSSVTTGERVRLLRTARGLRTEQLADKAGVHRNTIYNLEAGTFAGRDVTLHALADAMGAEHRSLEDDQAMVEQLARWLHVQPGATTTPPVDPVQNEALDLLRQLGPDRARHALALLRSLLTLQGEPPTSGKG